MTITVQQFDFATPEYDESIRLRTAILRIPLGLEFKIKDLEAEYNSIHLGAYNQRRQMVGCLVLKPLEKGVYKMRQVAVVEAVQGKGVGSIMVEASEKLLRQLGGKMIELNARDTAIPFYEKLNYKKEGSEFTEVGIPHFKMIKKL